MGMQTDVKAAYCAANASTTAFAGRSRLKGLVVAIPAAGGTVTAKDGGASGDILFVFTVPSGDATVVNILVPGEGVLFKTDMYVTCSANMPVTVFYG
jgi:hypothetical protein